MGDRSDKLVGKYSTEDRFKELVSALATKTNLSRKTVEDLLRNGWSFHQELGKPDRWIKQF